MSWVLIIENLALKQDINIKILTNHQPNSTESFFFTKFWKFTLSIKCQDGKIFILFNNLKVFIRYTEH